MAGKFLSFALIFTSMIGCVFQDAEPTSPALKIHSTTNRKLTISDFGFDKPTQDQGSEFTLNGVNETQLIEQLTKIAGKTIEELELQMRPGAPGERGSVKGFLGRKESLLKVLANDNRTVVEEHGLSHQQLAAPLLMLTQLNSESSINQLQFGEAHFYRTMVASSNGLQLSPFGDELETSQEITLYNSQTKKSLEFSTLVPMMIYRYGFYEGLGTSYRIPPKNIINFFGEDFLKSIVLPSSK